MSLKKRLSNTAANFAQRLGGADGLDKDVLRVYAYRSYCSDRDCNEQITIELALPRIVEDRDEGQALKRVAHDMEIEGWSFESGFPLCPNCSARFVDNESLDLHHKYSGSASPAAYDLSIPEAGIYEQVAGIAARKYSKKETCR